MTQQTLTRTAGPGSLGGRLCEPRVDNPYHARHWSSLAVLCLIQLMVVLDATVVKFALASAQKMLGLSNPGRPVLDLGAARVTAQ